MTPKNEKNKKTALLAYVPVLHDGYRKFFNRHRSKTLFILGKNFIKNSEYLKKEIRAIDPETIKSSVETWKIFDSVKILEESNRDDLDDFDALIAPREDAIEEFIKKNSLEKKVAFEEIFLRWDKHNTVREFPANPDIKISQKEFDKEMMLKADNKSRKSSDWWRRVGAVIVKNGKIIISTFNRHVPSEQMPFVNGDPRSCFHKGINLELSTSIHAEAGAIAEAARRGVSLEGASIYVNNFPCPPCAKLIAYSGIKELYYNIGYGVLDAESILKSQGVKIILVDMNLPQKKGPEVIVYKK